MQNLSIKNFKIAPGFVVIQKLEDASERKTKSGLFIAGDSNELKTGRVLASGNTLPDEQFPLFEGDFIVYSSLTLGKCPFSFFDVENEKEEIEGYIISTKNVVLSYRKE